MCRIRSIAISIALLFCLSAVLFATGAQQTPSTAQASGPITLTMLNYVDMSAPEGRTWESIRAAFESAYPNIRLDVTNLYNDPYHQRLAAMAAAGQLPDLMYLWPGGRSAELTRNGLVADLAPRLSEVRNLFKPAALAPQGPNGQVYELPIAVTASHVMYANMEVLNQLGLSLPTTYAELVAMVPRIRAAGMVPILMANSAGWVMTSCLYSTILGRFAGDQWFRNAIAGNGAHFTDDVFVQSLAFVQRMYRDGVLDASTLQMDYGAVPGLFANGQSPFLIDGDWRTGALIDPALFTEQEQANVVMIPFPSINGETRTVSFAPGTGVGMSAALTGARAEAAWTFVKFYSGYSAAVMRLSAEGIFPAMNIDVNIVRLQPLMRARAAYNTEYGAASTAVTDNLLVGEPNGVLETGLQQLALGQTTPQALAQAMEAAVQAAMR